LPIKRRDEETDAAFMLKPPPFHSGIAVVPYGIQFLGAESKSEKDEETEVVAEATRAKVADEDMHYVVVPLNRKNKATKDYGERPRPQRARVPRLHGASVRDHAGAPLSRAVTGDAEG
jgi:hypothetical protein